MYSKDNAGRRSTSNQSNQIPLHISVSPAGDLHQIRNALAEVAVANGWLKNREVEVQFCSTNNVDAPLDVVIP